VFFFEEPAFTRSVPDRWPCELMGQWRILLRKIRYYGIRAECLAL